ncbi:MAG: mono/diheme cytochrome c family protein [Planctomycetota bacterium]|jgi:mono/diheme cytochrome c family protein
MRQRKKVQEVLRAISSIFRASYTLAVKFGLKILIGLSVVGLASAAGERGQAAADSDANAATALLAERCFDCHASEKQKGELRFDLRENALRPREGRFAAIVAGSSETSEAIRRVKLRDDDIMPPKGEPLTDSEVDLLSRWIDAGSIYPEVTSEPETAVASFPIEGVEEQEIRELLVNNCSTCHGDVRQRSGLRFDDRSSALAELESGRRAIVPGSAESSELIRRVKLTDDDAMPANSELLSEEQIELLTKWIDQGAPWPSGMESKHWAYIENRGAELPDVYPNDWVRNEIDLFIAERLDREGLKPAPEADRATLLRRLSFDLTGLPPTSDELAAFLADTSKHAYKNVVNRLFASPHFGERWGRHWLDLARYSDSNGYSRDFERSIWPYRDWVVNAFNQDMPFDQFTIEQIAGDLLPNRTKAQQIATGFNRNTLVQNEGGADDEEFRVEAVKNRVETTSTVWLGSTMICAQCHDHKYDPFEQRDYYELFAFFNQTADLGRSTSPRMELPTREQMEFAAELDPKIEELGKQLSTITPELREARGDWEKGYEGEGDWEIVDPVRVSSTFGVEFEEQEDGSFLATGPLPDEAVYSILVEPSIESITGIRLEVLPDPSLKLYGPGRGGGGNFVLTEFIATKLTLGETTTPEPLEIKRVTTSFEHKLGLGAASFDGDRTTGWAVKSRTSMSHQIVYTFAEPFLIEAGTRINIDLEQEFGDELCIGRFRISLTSAEEPPRAAVIPRELLLDILNTPPEFRLQRQSDQLDEYFLSVAPGLESIRKERERLMELRPKPVSTLVMQKVAKPRRSHVLNRGNFLSPGEVVEPGVPDFVLPFQDQEEPRDRLSLAKWLVDRKNPLTARVQVNRWWQRFFGIGLVPTENDFGTRGTRPSHPELLDWLARDFVMGEPHRFQPSDGGWDVKRTLKRMVMSATYRQSSKPRADVEAADSKVELFANQKRIRLEGEVIRDSALLASGKLVRTMGGPPVYPPMSSFNSVTAATKAWPESTGPDRYRRTLYTWMWRNSPYPFVSTFDGAGANDACTRRSNSNTPLQALVMANDPMIFELAQALALRVLNSELQGDAARMRAAFEWCLARKPTQSELELLMTFLSKERESFRASIGDAHLVAPTDFPASTDVVDAAAWTSLARVLFNLDEFVTRG